MFHKILPNSSKIFNFLKQDIYLKRNLYGASTMGLDAYQANRERVKTQFLNTCENFKTKMKAFVDDKSTGMVFTEDLKTIVHLVDKKDEDMELLVKMIKRFNAQNSELRFGNFIFGPVIMRMFYHLKEVDLALECFKDPELDGFFDQLITFQLLTDLLYENKRYQDVLDVYDNIKTRQNENGKYPRHTVVIVMAACFKLNTPESFDYAIKLWRELNSVGHVLMRKGITFAAGLAIRQNASHIAIEILSSSRNQMYVTVRNLKALAYAEIGRPDDSLSILRSVIEIDDPTNSKKHTFNREVIEKINESILNNNKKELEADFNRIVKFLNDNGQISEETIDDILCSEINLTSVNSYQKDKNLIAAGFRDKSHSNDYEGARRQRVRQGLRDLY